MNSAEVPDITIMLRVSFRMSMVSDMDISVKTEIRLKSLTMYIYIKEYPPGTVMYSSQAQR